MDEEPDLLQRLMELDTEVLLQLLNGERFIKFRPDAEREEDPFIQFLSGPNDSPRV